MGLNREDRLSVLAHLKTIISNQQVIYDRIELSERRTVIGGLIWLGESIARLLKRLWKKMQKSSDEKDSQHPVKTHDVPVS